MFIRGFDIHPGTPWVWREPNRFWPLETCSFCGSVKPETFLRFLHKGYGASGTDWKYGWPHKFYVSSKNGQWWKFYSEHLGDAQDDTVEPLLEELAKVLGIKFEFDVAGRMTFKAPSFGYQTYREHPIKIQIEDD